MTDITQPRTTAECYADELDRMRGDYGPRDPQEYPHEAYAVDALEAGAAALRVLAQPPAQGGWQPMETAPKDGTAIDLFADGVRVTDCTFGTLDWEITYLKWPGDTVGWRAWSDRDDTWGRVENVTHWMPLPALPTQDKETK